MKAIGVGIVGTGWVSGEHVKAFEANPHTEVRGIVSRGQARAVAWAKEQGLAQCKAYDHLEPMLEDPAIQVVSICTPHNLHAAQGIAAAKAGKHLMLEKPVALDLASLRELQAAVRATKVKTVVSFVLRWNPLFEMVKALIADGIVGQLFYAELDYLHGIGPWYAQYDWNIKKSIVEAVACSRLAATRSMASAGLWDSLWLRSSLTPTSAEAIRWRMNTNRTASLWSSLQTALWEKWHLRSSASCRTFSTSRFWVTPERSAITRFSQSGGLVRKAGPQFPQFCPTAET